MVCKLYTLRNSQKVILECRYIHNVIFFWGGYPIMQSYMACVQSETEFVGLVLCVCVLLVLMFN